MSDVELELKSAELEIRSALDRRPGAAMTSLNKAYAVRNQQEREIFAIALISHLVSAKANYRTSS
jgi:hypothetical protein